MDLTNFIQADTTPRKRYTAIRLTQIEAEAKQERKGSAWCIKTSNYAILEYKRPRVDEEGENAAKRCRFIDNGVE